MSEETEDDHIRILLVLTGDERAKAGAVGAGYISVVVCPDLYAPLQSYSEPRRILQPLSRGKAVLQSCGDAVCGHELLTWMEIRLRCEC